MQLANGRYKAKAQTWGLGETSSGKEQVAVLFELKAEEPAINGLRITWYGYFTEATLETTIKALRACGWRGNDLLELEEANCGVDTNEVELVVENEQELDAQGQPAVDQSGQPVMRPKVRWVNTLGGLALRTPLQGDKAKAFAARMKASILALEQGKPKPAGQARPAAGRQPEPPPHSDLDAPPF